MAEAITLQSRDKSVAAFYAFLFSTLINFLLALKAPLWVLVLGPIFLGFPHIASVMREVPRVSKTVGAAFSVRWIGFFFASIALAHFIFNRIVDVAVPAFPNFIELVGALLIFGAMFWAASGSGETVKRFSFAIFLLSSLFLFSAFYPLETLGALVLIHNFVGFFYWMRATKSRDERRVAISSLLMFALLTALILFGLFDFVILAREKEILRGSLNEFSIGHFIFPNASGEFWSRGVSAFAFGQGVHYFVWLRAIPDRCPAFDKNFMRDQIPSLKEGAHSKLRGLIGQKNSLLRFAFLGSLALLVYALLTSFSEARLLYLGLAAFHGYFEIVGLGFFSRERVE